MSSATYRRWGDDLDAAAIAQMDAACSLPIAARGALMPDAHVGYGLPIGGVLATREAVIPYAVGVDIACRVKMSVLDLPPAHLGDRLPKLREALLAETRFGLGSCFENHRRHAVMDANWTASPVTRRLKDKASTQLGSSGGGNHFVEFGLLEIDDSSLGLPAGDYLALLSHSGSRGTGANVCSHYSRLAMHLHPNLPKHLRYLAWLDMTTHDGQEYWAAMQLMGKYAAANHAMIHHHIARHLGVQVLADIENHHNFAWQETHRIGGETKDVIVHRKGATPAGRGVLGIIPGSMATPCYVVRGKGSAASMHSAAHGAGRVMSRRKAKQTYRWPQVEKLLKDRGVILLSAGIDEVPFVYKDIDTVMSQQRDLTEPVARF
ncbi:MAG: RtcB family protein, partial [Acidobacteria bacterium]|nr:RtcB family protein [Acidobacteriota bacterium]